MTELQAYGINGLFHNIVKQSAIINGRYQILPNTNELNRNNLLSGLDLPKAKYPAVFCLSPVSELPGTVQGGQWETFSFRLLFLCTTNYTGDNKIKSPDPNTNSSLHTVPMDWSDMKDIALGFMNALESIHIKLKQQFRLTQSQPWRIIRISNMQNDNVSGVLLTFNGSVSAPCEFTDIDISGIEIPADTHPQHYH